MLSSDEISVEKKTKKGSKTIDLKEYIIRYELNAGDEFVTLVIELPAGSSVNINPSLFVSKLENDTGAEIFSQISRKEIYTKEGKCFA